MYEELTARNPSNASIGLRHGLGYLSLSLLGPEMKNWPSTIDAARRAARIFEPLQSSTPAARQYLARSYFQTGRGYEGLGKWAEARNWYQRSVDLWQEIKSHGRLEGANAGRDVDAAQALAESEKHLAR